MPQAYPGAYGGGTIDFSPLAQIGEDIGGLIKSRRDKDSVSAALEQSKTSDGTYDWNKAAGLLLSAGDLKSATVVSNMAESEATARYRNESLVPESIREYRYLEQQGSAAPQQPSQPGVSPVAQAQGPSSYEQFKAARSGGTPAQKAVDQTFGKEYADWVAAGGSSVVGKSLDQLYGSLGTLRQRDDVSGPIIGNLPKVGGTWGEAVQSWAAPESIKVQQDVEEPIQTNLRKILGSQYTEKEGENLLRRTYDPRLQEPVNAERVGRVIVQLKTMAEAKEAAARYYEANGTLRGFTGKLPTLEDVRKISPDGKTQEQLLPEGGGVSASPVNTQGSVGGPAYGSPGLPTDEGPYAETGPRPPADVMQMLYQNAADPEFRATFEKIYGAGSVDRWLGNEGWTGR
jgi:hypothetical protein